MRSFYSVILIGWTYGLSIASAATTESLAGAAPSPSRSEAVPGKDQLLQRTLGDFLTTASPLTVSFIPGFYTEVPVSLDSAVRRIAEENYTSAVAELLPQSTKLTDTRERARVLMWLGLSYGSQAIDYPNTGWQFGTTATAYLKQAIAADPEVFQAPDVARVLAEMVAHGWADEDPTAAVAKYEQKAEQTRKSVDFFFAGVISRRMSARAWSYSDTTDQDKRTVANFSKAVALEPLRYENWPAYLRALMPVGLHDLATTEARKMYAYFKALRTPVLGDQGPAALYLQTASYKTMQDDENIIAEVEKRYPDSPFPMFERGMRAIETTATDALKIFPEFIARVKAGKIKLDPREQGYLPSAYYKMAFLQQQFNDIPGALQSYLNLKEISPHYAEVDSNLAVVYAQLSESETTSPKKLQLLQKAVRHASEQEKHDFRGRAALKASEMRQKLRQAARRVEAELKPDHSSADTGTTAPLSTRP
ncbi:MAG: tetratricopeptide repeat protein [Candidatus Sumerlaeaceae bacterium]